MENTATVIATTKTILAQRILQQEGDGADLTDAELAGIRFHWPPLFDRGA